MMQSAMRTLSVLTAAAAVVVAVCVDAAPGASVARVGSIRGRVEVRRAATPAERRPGVAELGTAAARDLPDLLRSVVYLESAPRGAFESTDSGRVVMDQRNETFVPHVLAIMTGTTVDFPNSDKF